MNKFNIYYNKVKNIQENICTFYSESIFSKISCCFVNLNSADEAPFKRFQRDRHRSNVGAEYQIQNILNLIARDNFCFKKDYSTISNCVTRNVERIRTNSTQTGSVNFTEILIMCN